MPDTEGARADMHIAHQYITQWEHLKKPTHDNLSLLDFASKYIASAQRKDPDATLLYKQNNGEVGQWNLSRLEATREFHIGQYRGSFVLRETSHRQAVAHFKNAIALQPGIAAYHWALADAYANIGWRKKAIDTYREAHAKFPDNFNIRMALDKIEADPKIGAAPVNPDLVMPTDWRRVWGIILLICLAITGFVFYAPPNIETCVFWVIVSGLVFWIWVTRI
jgi:tetratricopeptide (TPR) repeat protein